MKYKIVKQITLQPNNNLFIILLLCQVQPFKEFHKLSLTLTSIKKLVIKIGNSMNRNQILRTINYQMNNLFKFRHIWKAIIFLLMCSTRKVNNLLNNNQLQKQEEAWITRQIHRLRNYRRLRNNKINKYLYHKDQKSNNQKLPEKSMMKIMISQGLFQKKYNQTRERALRKSKSLITQRPVIAL